MIKGSKWLEFEHSHCYIEVSDSHETFTPTHAHILYATFRFPQHPLSSSQPLFCLHLCDMQISFVLSFVCVHCRGVVASL